MANRAGKRERKARNRHQRGIAFFFCGTQRIALRGGRNKRFPALRAELEAGIRRAMAAVPVADDDMKSPQVAERQDPCAQGECAAAQADHRD